MIDLHTHTDASDGSDSPEQLLEKATRAGIQQLAITDHDTLDGYEIAATLADGYGIELLCGIELSTKRFGKTVHLLGYFPNGRPPATFCDWLLDMQVKRRDRNVRLANRLQSLGFAVTIEEVERVGRNMAGRPHFAKIMLQKGFVKTLQEAFDRYLTEGGSAYVEREEVPFEEGVARVREAGGVTVVAHPVRLNLKSPEEEERWIGSAAEIGLQGLEIIHSDHNDDGIIRYARYAEQFGLTPTGGSDYHGTYKPDIELGTGRNGNVAVPRKWLDRLRDLAVNSQSSPTL